MGLDIYFDKRNVKNENEDAIELAYFRKVNFLVMFMENYGEVENCVPMPLSKDIIEELIERCDKVINLYETTEDKTKFAEGAKEILPTTAGFFFGSTDYDEYYLDDVKDVKEYMETSVLPAFDSLNEDEEIIFHIWY